MPEEQPARPARKRLALLLTVSAGLLMLSWIVPDAIAKSAHFPWDRLRVGGAFEIAAALAPAACGALLLIAVLLPIPLRARAVAGRIIGPAAIVLPLLGAAPAVPMAPWIVAVAAVAGAAAAALLLVRYRELWAHVVLGALPVAMVGVWLSGVMSGEPVGFLAGLEAPVVLYAGMLATAVSAGTLIAPAARG